MKSLREYVKPATKKDLRAYLRFTGYYRKFIPNFATHSAALTDATAKQKPEKLEWTDRMTQEYKHLKKTLLESTALNAFDPKQRT